MKTHLTDLSIFYLDLVKQQLTEESEELQKLSEDILNLVTQNQDQLLNYEESNQSLDSLLDLILLSEFLSITKQELAAPILSKVSRLSLN